MNNVILKIENLKINIKVDEGTLTPVRGVNFEIKANETLGLVGESGCGKSLTCKAILGINSPNCKPSGQIKFYSDKEVDLLNLKPKELCKIRGKDISMIFQEPMSAFSPLFTIGNQLREAVLLHMTKDKKQAKEIVIKSMIKVGISNPEKRYTQYPNEFSGGMLQRALIAMSLVCNPKLLIADEPTTALDVTIQAQILELLGELQKEYNMAILYITHDLGTVAQICDKVCVMYLGKVIEMASVNDIFKNPVHPYTQGLIGSVHKIGERTERLFSIEGSVPLAMNLPDRCGFYDRCNKKCDGICDGAEPTLKEISENHFVACYTPLEKGE